MKVIRVVGPVDADRATLIEELAGRLADRGTVGVVGQVDRVPDVDGTDAAGYRGTEASEAYSISADGQWLATGENHTVADLLDELAVSCDFVLLDGDSDGTRTLPTVAVGDVDVDEPLAHGEIAADVDGAAVVAALADVDPYETLESLVARVKESPRVDRAGAIATFTGRVRTKDAADDDATEYLEFERYDEVANERLAAIREELTARDGVYEVLLHHRTGVVESGEDIVFVVVLAGHRTEAFETVEDGINRLKDEVPLFKKEVTVADEFWAHQHDEQYHPK